MTLGYAEMLEGLGVSVQEKRNWPIEWINFRPHPCPWWPGVQHYREAIAAGRAVEPVVLCKDCFSILDGWHRVAAHWQECNRFVTVRLAERHIGGAEGVCLVQHLDWIDKLRPWADLPCVSGAYHKRDWKVPAFAQVRKELEDFGGPAPMMRMWERARGVCFLGNVAGKKILDVGSRESKIPHWLAAQRADVTVVDVDVSQVVDDGTIRVVEGDVQNLPVEFDDEEFDFVVCNAVLKSIPHWGDQRAVCEMMRVLKPGGLLAISVDYGERYIEFPGDLTGVRTYNKAALYERIIDPSRGLLEGPVDFDRSDWNDWPIKSQAPRVFKAGLNVQVAFVLLRKDW